MPSQEFHFLPSTRGSSLSSINTFFIAPLSVLKFSSDTFALCALNVPYTFCLVFAVSLAEFYFLRSVSSMILLPNPFCSLVLIFELRSSLYVVGTFSCSHDLVTRACVVLFLQLDCKLLEGVGRIL